LRHPPRESLSHRNAQRRKQPEIVAIHIFRHQFIAVADVDGNRVVGHRAAQFHRKYGKRFAQTERSPQVLAEFEQRLRFLPRRRDRTEKAALLRLPPSLRLETGVGLNGRFPIPSAPWASTSVDNLCFPRLSVRW